MKEVFPRVRWRDNPVLWLVLGIPLLTVAAGVYTLWLAAGTRATDSHPDRVQRTAQMQEASLAADEAAAARGLSARIELSADATTVVVLPSSGPVAPILRLVHPLESALDRELALAPGSQGWRAPPTLAGRHAWQLQLVAADGSWRLVGRYWPGDASVAMTPAVAAP
ncbi:FixH family protein [Arenimonas sp. MALMAid1274]|uniref:FixH family protein n=1 Tax=Arenimonas sp. MALMAid1274 TaxID=3411630 RepID=UPI003BA1AEA8